MSCGAHVSVPGNASSYVKYVFCIPSTAEEIAIWKKNGQHCEYTSANDWSCINEVFKMENICICP